MSPLISVALLQPVEFVLNRLIKSDPHIRKQLSSAAAGRSMTVRCTSAPEWQLTLQVNDDRLMLISAPVEDCDAELAGSLSALLQLVTSDDPAAALHHPELTLNGDIGLIQNLHRLLHTLDVRWDDLLAPWLGDVSTHTLHNAAGHVSHTVRRGAQSLRLDMTDYLQEESRILPKPDELAEFSDRLDDLRLRTDRLRARVERLRQSVTN